MALSKAIDYFLNLIQPEVLENKFEREKLYHRLQLIKLFHADNRVVNQAVDYLCSAYFPEKPKAIPELSDYRVVHLPDYYKDEERSDINRLFGFKPNNSTLTLAKLESGYQQNQHLDKIKDWYYRLLWCHFKPKSVYDNEDSNELTNRADELLYARNNPQKR